MNLISQFGAYFRKSPAVIIVFIALLVALTISISTTVEDYSTSLQGYNELPTRKINTWVIPLVAALPQVLQILMTYAFATDTKRAGWALGIGVVAHLVDVSLDIFYKVNGDWGLVPIAIIETEFVYTFGSEFLLTFSFGLIIETFPDFIRQTTLFTRKVMDAIGDVVDNKPRQQPPPPKFQPPTQPQAPNPNRQRSEQNERRW